MQVVAGRLQAEGYDLGDWQHEPPPLTIDFVFVQSHPRPVAVEISEMPMSGVDGGRSAMRKMEERLNEQRTERGWPENWLVVVDPLQNIKSLTPEVEALIDAGRMIRPGDYTSEDLRNLDSDAASEFGAMHSRLERMGLTSLQPTGREGRIKVHGFTGPGSISGFPKRLGSWVADNTDKFRPVVNTHWKHLVVVVTATDLSAEPRRTPPPPLPVEIDRLWVIHTLGGRREGDALWWCDRGAFDWTTEPHLNA